MTEQVSVGSEATIERTVEVQVERMDMSDFIDIIDLCTPINDVALTVVTTSNQAQFSPDIGSPIRERAAYKSRTLIPNSGRHSILPAFPTSIENDHPDLLLANVPHYLLNREERERRRARKYRPPFHVIGASPTSILVNTKIPSFFWPFYQEFFDNTSEHLHVDLSIIDYNYARLSTCIDIWAKERILRFKNEQSQITLHQNEYAIALEFFLQIDVDLFYMKTCSFRNVQPHPSEQFLFCSLDPVARHEMSACGNCGLCYPKYDVKTRCGGLRSVDFGLATRRHQFINRYETILNCPCSCDTSNIIYVLTCPCGKFDYVGESGVTLADRITAHRYHGNRILHESFLGQENIKAASPYYVKSNEVLSKDDMRLYRHSTECPTAVQMFLDENPRYWRFTPMTIEETEHANQAAAAANMEFKALNVRTDEVIKSYIQNLPAPPPNYRFSMRQYYLQYAFFKSERDKIMPNSHLDLYNAKIIALLPEKGSKVLRQIVESLFITHAETKLNSSGRLVSNSNDNINKNDDDDNDASSRHPNVVWCDGLVRRPLAALVTTKTATTF